MIEFSPLVQDAFTVFYAILFEAIPFVALGALISAGISVFVSEEKILQILPKNKLLSHIALACLGFLFPVCECGNIPVAKRLLQKGLSTSHAVTFLLAAPVVNPVVLLSTYAAFSFSTSFIVARYVISFAIALIIGLTISLLRNQKALLDEKFAAVCELPDHDHHHNKRNQFLEIFITDVYSVLGLLIFGAAVAAIISVTPRSSISSIASSPLLAIIAMMLLAFIMTICSTVDGFVALGFIGIFPLSSLLAFLTFGPMIDIRSLSIMRSIFSTKLIGLIILMVTQLVIIFSVGYSFIGG